MNTRLTLCAPTYCPSSTQVVPEPVDRWQDVAGPSGRLNLLKTFYDDPKRYAYPFQNYVFLTRVMAVSLGVSLSPRA
jgi:deoxyadenosine/deoxycytidine kinase